MSLNRETIEDTRYEATRISWLKVIDDPKSIRTFEFDIVNGSELVPENYPALMFVFKRKVGPAGGNELWHVVGPRADVLTWFKNEYMNEEDRNTQPDEIIDLDLNMYEFWEATFEDGTKTRYEFSDFWSQ